ncbi:hypothetical protein BJ546DRAFT_176299 [Cryomyces antarcticus]
MYELFPFALTCPRLVMEARCATDVTAAPGSALLMACRGTSSIHFNVIPSWLNKEANHLVKSPIKGFCSTAHGRLPSWLPTSNCVVLGALNVVVPTSQSQQAASLQIACCPARVARPSVNNQLTLRGSTMDQATIHKPWNPCLDEGTSGRDDWTIVCVYCRWDE